LSAARRLSIAPTFYPGLADEDLDALRHHIRAVAHRDDVAK
jgi:hypothetical protein